MPLVADWVAALQVAVYILTVGDADNAYQKHAVFNQVDNAIVPHANTVESLGPL